MKDTSITMPVFVEYIKRYIPIPKVIMDLGCMDATDALYFKECFPLAKVYAIEGLEDNYNLIKNFNTIIPIQAVVCDKDGETMFYHKNINGIHGIYDRGDVYGSIVHIVKCCKFKTLIDTVIKEPFINVLKIDVEGATYDVLLGMEEYIHNIGIIHLETETGELFKGQILENDVFNYLEKNRFKKLIHTSCFIQDGKYQCDSVWLNEENKCQ